MPKNLNSAIWRRHANPWSVYTRFAAIPVGIFAGWSRIWVDWWLISLGIVAIWLVINPFAFKPIQMPPTHWISKGILGEQLWLEKKGSDAQRSFLRVLLIFGVIGMVTMISGVIWLQPHAAVIGAILVTITQLWRIRRFARVYDDNSRDAAGAELGTSHA